jgi:NADPH-dependent curcumin reductase CurA
VIGSVGSDAKVKFVKEELKFDEAFNYKEITNREALTKFAPEGIDIYFENVGGEALEAALEAAKVRARFVMCGMISYYNAKSKEEMYLPGNLMHIIAKRLLLQGFIVGDPDMGPKYAKEHLENVSKWLANHELIVKESITEGVENAAEGLLGLFKGQNFGKGNKQSHSRLDMFSTNICLLPAVLKLVHNE